MKNQTLAWLDSLTDQEFASFFYEATRNRSTSDRKKWKGHFVLADAEKLGSEPWQIDYIGCPVENEDWDKDVPIAQSGSCIECGNRIRSWSKQPVCPICGAPVHCT